MFLNEDFLKIWEELSDLNESKADIEKLTVFAGEDLADRFLKVKSKLKPPKNDLYYWIKNKSKEELEAEVKAIEATFQVAKDKKDQTTKGATLVSDTYSWKVYHITSFEAAQKYGRDTKWCITSAVNYWNDYKNRGADFYFLITNENYDPRGLHSKIALAIYPDNYCEVFDQQDNKISLADIPHRWDFTIPDKSILDLHEVRVLVCEFCEDPVTEDSYYLGPNGEYYCEKCYNEHFD
jgi:type IV secretory pathway VirB4 component